MSKKFWTEGWGSFALAILLALTIRWAVMEAYVIPSGSMFPSLLIHDHIFVNKAVYGVRVPFSEKWLIKYRKPDRGEIVIFKYPNDKSTFYVKRVVGLPGDKILWDKGKLYINDEPVKVEEATDSTRFDRLRDKDFQRGGFWNDSKNNYQHFFETIGEFEHSILINKFRKGGATYGPITVPEDRLFVMGDNRDNSSDSRRWGFVPMENILGKAMFVWLSCNETLPVVSFLCNPLTIRWGRMLNSVH